MLIEKKKAFLKQCLGSTLAPLSPLSVVNAMELNHCKDGGKIFFRNVHIIHYL